MIVLAIVSAQLADLLTFMCMTRVLSIAAEGNPVAGFIFLRAGWPGVALFKLVGTALIIIVALRLSGRRRLTVAIAAVGFGLFGALSNTLGLLTFARPL